MTFAKELIQKEEALRTERATFEHHWAEIAPLVFPRADVFFNVNQQEGERRTRNRYDDTAALALEHGAAAVESIVTPRNVMWHGIGLPDDIADDYESQIWADRLTKFLFSRRYRPATNFASQLYECYLSLLAFGTSVLIVEDMLDGTLRYRSSHIGEHCFMENNRGIVDCNYRRYKLTARQALEKFKERTPDKVVEAAEKKPSQKFEFLHVVMPSNGEDTDMAFVSYHVCVESNAIISVGGFETFPYIISRWTTSPNEKYGRSPTMTVLAEIKMLNQMRRTDIKARHMAVDPPILASDQATVRKFSMRPGAINYGTLDMNGNPLVRPYSSNTNVALSNDGIAQSKEFINRAFFLNLFQILVESPQKTATEVLQLAQEKGQLLTPTAGRQMSELLDPMVMREISIYESYGIFEDGAPLQLPEAVKEMGGEFDIVYTNPLSRMQISEQALGVERTIQSMIPLAQIDPTILDKIDWDAYSDIMREANGAPARLFRSPEQMAEIQAAKQEEAAMQQMIAAAPQVAGAVKDIAQAEALQGEQ